MTNPQGCLVALALSCACWGVLVGAWFLGIWLVR